MWINTSTYVWLFIHVHDLCKSVMSYIHIFVCKVSRTHRQSNLAQTLWGILPKVTTTDFSTFASCGNSGWCPNAILTSNQGLYSVQWNCTMKLYNEIVQKQKPEEAQVLKTPYRHKHWCDKKNIYVNICIHAYVNVSIDNYKHDEMTRNKNV